MRHGCWHSRFLLPYAFRLLSSITTLNGAHPAIGSMCNNEEGDRFVNCVDTYGTTEPSVPASTVALAPTPTAQAVSINSNTIAYNGTWNVSNLVPKCAISSSLRVTSQVNASVEFNYTGSSSHSSRQRYMSDKLTQARVSSSMLFALKPEEPSTS